MSATNHIICERRRYTSIKNRHAHNFYQLLLPLQGSLHVETKQQQVTLDHQHLFLLPPNCEHLFYSEDRNEFLVLDIPAATFPKDTLLGSQDGLYLPCNERWKAIRFLFLEEISHKPTNQQSLLHLLHYAAPLLQDKQTYYSIQYIHEHYHEEIAVQDLAAMEHYQVSYYIQWFREKTGQTPKAYIQELRLQAAKQLLKDTNLPITYIAHQVGYEYQSSLTRLFVQHEGVTPKEFRQQKQHFG